MEDRGLIRTGSIRIKVAPEMLVRIEAQAKALCMPVATVCAFAVGDWVKRQETNEKLARMAVLSASRQNAEELGVTDERIERLFGPMIAEMGKAMAQLPGSIDPEEPKGS
jgi:precorrin-6x reductase